MTDYTKGAIQSFLFILIGGAIALTVLAAIAPHDTGSAIDTIKTRITK